MKEEKEFAISGKQKVSVREETNAVSDAKVMIVQNRHPNTKRQKCVEKKELERQKPVWEVQPTAVQKLLERYLH